MTQVDIIEISCCNCGVLFFITKKHNAELIRSKERFYCPNGHRQSYVGKTDAQKLAEEKEKSKRYYDWYKNQVQETDAQKRKLNASRGNYTKAKKKIEELKEVNIS